jgi:hypothetical protein
MIDEAKINLLSDTTLYEEALGFVQACEMPDHRQLIGLMTFSRNWQELLDYVKHQGERDWGQQREYYKTFYHNLRRYLQDPQTGLRQRVKTEFALVTQGLSRNQEGNVLDAWAQALAQEFVQHLVAEASLRAQVGRDR